MWWASDWTLGESGHLTLSPITYRVMLLQTAPGKINSSYLGRARSRCILYKNAYPQISVHWIVVLKIETSAGE